MSPGNDQRRPGRGSGVEKVIQQQSNHRVSRPTDTTRAPRVRAELVVDLTEFQRWAEVFVVRRKLAVIEHAPAGAVVRLLVGNVSPMHYLLADLEIGHVHFVVVCDDVTRLHQWVDLLREATE